MDLIIETHDGKSFKATVKKYDAVKLNEMLNDNEVHTIVIGEVVLSRIIIKAVYPAEQKPE